MEIVGPVWYRPSFLSGIGSIINLFGGTMRLRVAEMPGQADAEAFRGDLDVLLQDFDAAVHRIEWEIAAARSSNAPREE